MDKSVQEQIKDQLQQPVVVIVTVSPQLPHAHITRSLANKELQFSINSKSQARVEFLAAALQMLARDAAYDGTRKLFEPSRLLVSTIGQLHVERALLFLKIIEYGADVEAGV